MNDIGEPDHDLSVTSSAHREYRYDMHKPWGKTDRSARAEPRCERHI